MEIELYVCNGCRSIQLLTDEEPLRASVRVMVPESGEEMEHMFLLCSRCQGKLAKKQPLYPFD